MASNNNNGNDAGAVIGLVCLSFGLIGLVFLLAFVFFAFLLTIMALCAWSRPKTIFGIYVDPADARSFVKRGIAGAFLLPAFCAFLEVFLGIPIEWDYLPYFMTLGYVGGSLGIDLMMAEEQQANPQSNMRTIEPSAQILPPERRIQDATPSYPSEPFRYASWNDEEGRS